jgi:filamentous hemagglutinin
MTGIEHIFYRHGPDSGFPNVGKFSQGTSVKDVSSYVDDALRYGKVTPNGPGGHVIEYNAGKVIGTNLSGAPTSIIKINVRDGVIQTAFPY